MLLLRWVKRQASFDDDIEETYIAEFHRTDAKPELTLSVYEVEDGDGPITRTHAECSAGTLGDPPRRFRSVNLNEVMGPAVVTSEGRTGFRFTEGAHRELYFKDAAALRQFVESIYNDQNARKRVSEKVAVKTYISDKRSKNDAEWVVLCSNKPKWEKWTRPKSPDIGEEPAATKAAPAMDVTNDHPSAEAPASSQRHPGEI